MSIMTIVHTADLHGDRRHGAIEAASSLLRHCPNAVWVDSGDALAAPNITLGTRWERSLERMSVAGCSAMALGNREFELFAPALGWKLGGARFPVVCTNMTHPRPDKVRVRSQVSLRVGGRRVRILGALRDMTARLVPRGLSGFRFRDPVASLAEAVSDAATGELVVLLSHLGQEADLNILESVCRIDLVLGGHDHVGWCAAVGSRAAVAPEPLGRQVAVIRVPGGTERPDVRLVRPDGEWGCS